MCYDEPARAYVQYRCALTTRNFDTNYKAFEVLIYLSFVSTFCFLTFYTIHILRVRWFKETHVTNDLVYPAAFSVELKVTEALWAVAKRKHAESQTEVPLLGYFRQQVVEFLNYELSLRKLKESDNTDIAYIRWITMDSRRLLKLQERTELTNQGKHE